MEINYEIHKSANKNAEDLVLVPGSVEGIERFKPYIKNLSKYFNVLVFDNPGVGKSPLVPFTAKGLAVVYLQIAEKVGFKEFHLLGHSFGGFTVQHMANIQPEVIKSLVIVSMGPGGAVKQSEILSFQLNFGPESFKELFGKKFAKQHPEFIENFIKQSAEKSVAVRAAYVIASIRNTTWQICPEIKIKTLIVHGDADGIVDVSNGRLLANLITGSKLLEFEDVGHFPYIEDDTCWQKIIDFCLDNGNIGTELNDGIVVTEKMEKQDDMFKKVSDDESFPEFMEKKVFKIKVEKGAEAAVEAYYDKVVNG